MSAEPRPDDLTVSVKVCGLPEDNPAHVERTAGIFTTFRPTAVEYVVKGDETEKELTALEKRGLSLVKVIRAEEAEGLDPTGLDEEDDEIQESPNETLADETGLADREAQQHADPTVEAARTVLEDVAGNVGLDDDL